MTSYPFIHLRTHSAYSLAEGAIRVDALVDKCVEDQLPAFAITDTSNIFGALEITTTATKHGVQAIIGALVNLEPPLEISPTDAMKKMGNPIGRFRPDSVVLLCQNEIGYQNLMVLLSDAYMTTESGADPHISFATLSKHHHGLILLTGGINGPIGKQLLANRLQDAEAYLLALKSIFNDRLYIELMRHGLAEQAAIESEFIALAYRHDIPLVATNDCHFLTKDMYEAHDALICIAEGSYISQSDRKRLTPEHYFKSSQEMTDLFSDLPEAVRNTAIIAKRCSYLVEGRAPLLPTYTKLQGRHAMQALRDLASAGLKDRLEQIVADAEREDTNQPAFTKPYWERLEFELGIIEQTGFPDYFLIVADFIQWARGQNIPIGPGRGSGAGSLVAYALTITDLDPLRYSLLFERFLNAERVSMPDFDIDFCQERRDEVIRYVQNEYGVDRVAQIITFGKLQARAVLRDVGRVMQMPYPQVDRICKMVPSSPANPVTLAQALQSEDSLRAEHDKDPSVQKLIEIALQLEGLYRHASTHAAGLVIADRPLGELVALYRDPRSEMPVTQFNMGCVDKAGLVKFDFLGLKTLTVIQAAVDLINARQVGTDKEPISIATISLRDKKTFDMLCQGESAGVFQLESTGMQDVLKKLLPDRVEDLIAAVALYRPGPMENIPVYIKRKHGLEKVVYMHPLLQPILHETFGIPIYQEQVMQMAQILAGYSLGKADLLRRAMGKKKADEMAEQRQAFVEGAKTQNGVAEKLAHAIFDQMNAFAGYGFVKSHATAYALVAYQTAWLKANYPAEFMAASMSLDMHNTDKLALFKQEVMRLKIPISPPDINKSEAKFTVTENDPGEVAVNYALAALKNVGTSSAETIVLERKNNGKFKDLYDFFSRVDARTLNKQMLENLIKAGAFDSLLNNRQQVLINLENLMGYGKLRQSERESHQVSLFGGDLLNESKPKLVPAIAFNAQQKLQKENEAIGFYLSGHPLDRMQTQLTENGVITWKQVEAGEVSGTQPIKMAGIPIGKRIMTTQKGARIAFLALSDSSGNYEVTLFQEALDSYRDFLDSHEPLLLTIDVKIRNGEENARRLLVKSMAKFEDELAKKSEGVRILIKEGNPVPDLYAMIQQHGKSGEGRVIFSIIHAEWDVIEVELADTYAISNGFRQAIKSIDGVMDVIVL